jgi:hypothetical protein
VHAKHLRVGKKPIRRLDESDFQTLPPVAKRGKIAGESDLTYSTRMLPEQSGEARHFAVTSPNEIHLYMAPGMQRDTEDED